MRRPILTFFVTTAVFLGFDMIWLGGIAKAFYLRELGGLARLVDGDWDPIVWAALLVYVLIPLGLTLFVLPRFRDLGTAATTGLAFVFGAILYGVYDLTNYATLVGWPVKVVAVDIVWGGVICAATTLVVTRVSALFEPKVD